MGVHGLWRLIEPSGKPVPLESLENKVLAVDVSIWLHQIIKGFQDSRGASVPHAHLLGIYHRVCKLLYFRIKPVFVFDGGVPVLKKNTIALRNQQKQKNLSEADRVHKNLLSALVKHTAISKVLSEKAKAAITAATSPTKKSKSADDDLYLLPASQQEGAASSSEDESSSDSHPSKNYDLHSIDTKSVQFKSLPVELRHEILTDLKDTRKQSSWGRIHELPAESDDFSVYQMRRLLKRNSVQTALEEVEKEMGGHSLSLGELEKLLKDQGIITNLKGSRIASDENTRFLLIKDIKQAVEDAKKQNLATLEEENEYSKDGESPKMKNKGDEEFQDDLKKAISMSLEEAPSTSKEEVDVEQASTSVQKVKRLGGKGKNRMPLSFLADFEDADFVDSESSEEETIQTRLTPAQRYMMEYSGLTSHAIEKIIASKSGAKNEEKRKVTNINLSKDSNDREERSAEDNKESLDNDLAKAIALSLEEVPPESVEVEEDAVVTAEEHKKVSAEDTVEVMSDSESSNSDEFVDVAVDKEKTEIMEVVIKPDEDMEDDLFKDIFEKEEKGEKTEKTVETIVSSSQDKVIESVKQFVSGEKELELSMENKEENSIGSQNLEESLSEDKESGAVVEPLKSPKSKSPQNSLKSNIERLIKEYSKAKENDGSPISKQGEKEETPKLTVEQLNEMETNLRKEQSELVTERSTRERLAGNITDQMCQEAQELLELFGVPYIVAPMEAEAQCAFLELISLTDGTITDDSDIWLFGGRTVYKNFFDQSKVVMEFRSENIHRHYKLTREQMILLAMLVGSDYTTGLSGVGPVTALEILAAFPPKSQLVSGLAEFKSWFKKGKLPGPGRTSLRGKLKNVSFTESFPNPQVIQAYLDPKVETSKEKFSWAKPDVVGLIEFARQKFGWTKTKSEDILSPILRRMEDHRTQKSITDFFRYEVKHADSSEAENKMSKRVKTAINRIAKGGTANEEEEEVVEKKKRVRKKKDDGDAETSVKRRKQRSKKEEDEEIKILKTTQARSKKRVEEIKNEVEREVEATKEKKVDLKKLHRREVIPQKLKDKSDILKNKMKAIETFRKSKQGPGYVKKRGTPRNQSGKKDADYLSEGSSSD